MKNTTSKNKNFDGFYVKTPITFLEDNTISAQAKLMMQLIMSDSNSFDVYLKNLAERMYISYSTAKRYMRELEDADYVYKKRSNNGWHYNIFFEKLTPDAKVKPDKNK